MKKVVVLFVVILTSFLAISCNKGDNNKSKSDLLIGYWQGEKNERGTYFVYDFENSGNGKYDMYTTGNPVLSTNFTWSLAEDVLSINDEEVEQYSILVLTDKTLRWQSVGSSKVENFIRVE